MKTSTLLILAGVVGVGVFLVTRKSSAASSSTPGGALTPQQATDCMGKLQLLYAGANQGKSLTMSCRSQGASSEACKALAAQTQIYAQAAAQYISTCKVLPVELSMPAAFEPPAATKGW